MANVLNTLNYGLGGTSGKSGSLQFMDDGSFIFRPVAGTGVEFAGFLQLDQQAAPAVAPSGTVRLYFDTSAQTIQQSIAGGAYSVFGATPTSITQGGGTVAVDASGNITATPSGTGSTTISGGAGGSIVMGAAGTITIAPLGGQALNINGTTSNVTIQTTTGAMLIRNTGTGTLILTSNNASGGITLNSTGAGMTFNGASSSAITMSSAGAITLASAAAQAINLNGPSSSSVVVSTAGAITLTPASGQVVTATNFTPVAPSAGMTYALPQGLGPTGAAVTLSSVSGGNPNVANYWLVYIPATITVGTIAVKVAGGNAGAHIGIGLYTYAASQGTASKLIDITLSAAAAAIVSGAPTQGATLVPAGWYWMGWTTDSAVAISVEGFTAYTIASPLETGVSGKLISAAGATASASGVLPAATGVLSAGPAGQTVPLVLFAQ